MRKNELIHLHGLLRMLADRLIETGAVDDDDLAAYRSLELTPMSLQASRDDHEAAVLLLSELLATAVATDEMTTADAATPTGDEPATERATESTDNADATEPPVH